MTSRRWGDDTTLCQWCGQRHNDVEPIPVRRVRQPDGPVEMVRWCSRCRQRPDRHVVFRPVETQEG